MLALLAIALLAQSPECTRLGGRCREARNGRNGRVQASFVPGAPMPLALQCQAMTFSPAATAFAAIAGQSLTFTRASSAYCSRSDGVVVLMATDAPRLEQAGLLLEPPSSNDVTDPRDLTTGNWTASNVTTAHTAVGVDGTANSATTLTATASNGTVKQTVTAVSVSRATSFYIKRRTGVGAISVTANDGSTWTDVSAELLAGPYARAMPACTDGVGPTPIHFIPNCAPASNLLRTAANQVIGIRISTSGDAVDVDMAQSELAIVGNATSPMIGFSRAVDVAQLSTTSGFPTTQGQMLIDWSARTQFGSGSVSTAVIDTASFNVLPGAKGVSFLIDAANGVQASELINSGTGLSILSPTDYPSYAGSPINTRFSWGSGNWYIWHDGIVVASVTDASAKMPDGYLQGYLGIAYTGSLSGSVAGWLSRVRFSTGAVTSFTGATHLINIEGDSIAAGTLVGDGSKPQQLLQVDVGGRVTGNYVSTSAQAGYTVDQCSAAWGISLAAIVASGFAATQHSRMVLQCGINGFNDGGTDPGAEYAALAYLLDSARDAGVGVVPCTVTPCAACDTASISGINTRLANWSADAGVALCNTYSALVVTDGGNSLRPEYSIDGEHPNAAGTVAMVNVWCATGACP